jgi:hypothetical protein
MSKEKKMKKVSAGETFGALWDDFIILCEAHSRNLEAYEVGAVLIIFAAKLLGEWERAHPTGEYEKLAMEAVREGIKWSKEDNEK